MSRAQWTASLLILSLAAAISAGAQIVPTTTLAAETGNNTAASNLWTYTANGDAVPRNVSKENIRKLMYPGFNGKNYAHLMGWFCQNSGSSTVGGGTLCGSHVQVGYNSSDPNQVAKQVNDMISRGIDGVIHDWYGQGSSRDVLESSNFLAEAEKHPGFEFAIMIDKGVSGGETTANVLTQMQYIAQTYFPSPSYMRWNGHPVVTNFALNVDWATIAAAYPDVIFLFQDNGGFNTQTYPMTDGSYSWVMPGDVNYGLNYLADFYNNGMAHPSLYTVGAMYKGFNDTIASWSANRIMDQQCGQTWLQTFAAANSKYSSSNQLPAIQLVTWDDYEEATEIETGIDNCVSVQATAAGTVLSWSITGAESTIDHYHVFISSDGQNLMSVGDVAVGTYQLDLAGYSFPAGTYTMYVKAVGEPSLTNKMSNPVSLTLAAPTSGGGSTGGGGTGSGGSGSGSGGGTTTVAAKTIGLSSSTSMATMMRGQSAQFQLTVTESGASDPVALSCSGMPAGMSCAFTPSTVTPGASGSSVALTVMTSGMMAVSRAPLSPRRGMPTYAFWMSGLGVAGLVTLPEAMRRKRRLLLLATLLGFAMLTLACGGGGSTTKLVTATQTTSSAASTYTVTVSATSGTVASSTNLSITVN